MEARERRHSRKRRGGDPAAEGGGGRRGAGGGHWPLRLALIATFALLVVTSAVVAATRSPARATTPTSTLPTTLPTTTTTTSASKTTGPTTPPPPTTTTVPGAFSGPVTRSVAGDGCGLALSPTPSPSGAVVSAPVGHCTVLEIGDSLGEDLAEGLADQLPASSGLNLVQLDKASTGLANSWFFNWPVNLEADLAQYHPQLVLVLLGGNDEQGMTVNGNVVSFPGTAWNQDYLAYVRQIVTEATKTGAYVLWIGMPITQPYSYNQGMMTLNALYQQGVTSEANATFVPTWSQFANPAGQFESQAAVNGVESTLRSSDGIHFSLPGAEVLATYVAREMARIYHVHLVPTAPQVITSWG
jgi:lysophospholipase L1-like esterase